jgi:uncharacterized protein
MTPLRLSGAGLGFRRELLPALKTRVPDAIDFFEIAPENWIDMGGAYGRDLRGFTERYPFVCHGLSLSLGGPAPLDEMLLTKTRQFMDAHGIQLYTEHLSYCSDDGHLYDLLPIPFTEEAVKHVAGTHPPRAGHPGTPHRDRKRLVLHGRADRRDGRAHLHSRRAR